MVLILPSFLAFSLSFYTLPLSTLSLNPFVKAGSPNNLATTKQRGAEALLSTSANRCCPNPHSQPPRTAFKVESN